MYKRQVQNTAAVGTATVTQDGPVQNATPFPIHDSTQEMATENTVPLPIAGDSDPRVESLVFGDSDPRMTAREQSLLQGDTPPEWVGRGQNAQTESQPQALPIAGEQTAKSRQYQTRAENQFVNEVAETLSIPGGARRDVLKPAAQRLTQEIRETGRVSAQTADAVFDEVYRQGRICLLYTSRCV